MRFDDSSVEVDTLYEMLEGQVAVLSSGLQSAGLSERQQPLPFQPEQLSSLPGSSAPRLSFQEQH